MKYVISLLSILILISSCGEKTQLFQASKLPGQYVSVRIDRDTEFVLQSGTRVFIPQNALQSKSVTVKLELKEAVTLDQIIAAGLLTQSNGKALSSGGMILINTADGEQATIIKPIKVKVPASRIQQGMQLFKGVETEDGINWENPQPIAVPKDTVLELGKSLYTNNCRSCHDPLKDATGPALYGSLERWPAEEREVKEMPYQFIRNSARVIAEGNSYANCLYDSWGKTAMTGFPNLSDAEIDAIYKYVNKEARERLGADTSKYLMSSADSCEKWKSQLEVLETELQRMEEARKPLLKVENTLSANQVVVPANLDSTKSYVQPDIVPGEYYNIEINTFGWFNIDIFVEEINGVKQSELFVRLTGTYQSSMQVLLIIPEYKVMVRGGLLEDGESFGFKETNGKLPLMQGVKAFIIALGESKQKDQLYFGKTSFITTISQKIEVRIGESDSAKMKVAITGLQLENVEVTVQKDEQQPARQKLRNDVQGLGKLLQEHCKCQNAYISEADTSSVFLRGH